MTLMNFLILLIISLLLIAIVMLSFGIGILLGKKNMIKQDSCSRNTKEDGIFPGCGCGLEHCCTR